MKLSQNEKQYLVEKTVKTKLEEHKELLKKHALNESEISGGLLSYTNVLYKFQPNMKDIARELIEKGI